MIECVRERRPGQGRPPVHARGRLCGPPLTRLKALTGAALSKNGIHRMKAHKRP